MKQTFASLIAASLLFSACSKDSVNTKPSLTFKSVSNTVVPINGGTSFNLTFGDKEGDIDSMFIYRTRLNIKKATSTLNDSIKLKVADYNKSRTGEINLNFTCTSCPITDYQKFLISAVNPPTSGTPPRNEADSMLYKFVVKDKSKNVSDTVYYSTLVILR